MCTSTCPAGLRSTSRPPWRAANSYPRHKLLFGTDYPLLAPERWLTDFAALDLSPEVRPKILKDNTVRLLGLDRA